MKMRSIDLFPDEAVYNYLLYAEILFLLMFSIQFQPYSVFLDTSNGIF